MCLIVFALQPDSACRLMVVANRDEYYRRETAAIHRWSDLPIIGGRDLTAHGTWMGVSSADPRRFAAVTNVRAGTARPVSDKRSRGLLPVNFLVGTDGADVAARQLVADAAEYAPVNLVVDDGEQLWWATNHPEPRAQRVGQGVHGLSNGGLDEPWPKVVRGTDALLAHLDAEPDQLLAMFADRSVADPDDLPDTGIPVEMELGLSAMFIDLGDYGTRASTVVRNGSDGHGDITERRFDAGTTMGETTLTW